MWKTASHGIRRLRDGLRHAFSLRSPYGELTEEDYQLLARLAEYIDRRGMSAPAIMFLESMRPLNYIGSQAMVFLKPILTFIFSAKEYERMAQILDRREGVSALVAAIEEATGKDAAGGDA